jgi:MSHA pilin protein MshA
MLATRISPRQAGFTLVELVIVILILGILSAVAVPRFLNLGVDARKAKAEALFGSVRAASQVVRAASLVNSQTGATGSVTLDGATINTVYGYPAATSADGVVSAAGIDATADHVTVAVNAGVLTIQMNGATTAANCQISYTAAASANATPTISLVTNGC